VTSASIAETGYREPRPHGETVRRSGGGGDDPALGGRAMAGARGDVPVAVKVIVGEDV